MADYSKLSDDELMALVQPKPAQDYSKVSDADLLKMVNPQRSVVDKLTGMDGGERYQTWPEKLVRGFASSAKSAATLPGDVMAGEASPNDTGRVLDLATMGTPVNPAVRAGDQLIPGAARAVRAEPAAVPTTRELAEAGAKDFESFRNSGLEVTSGSVSDLARRIQQRLYDEKGIAPVDAPATFEKLKALENAPPGSYATAANLKSLRESFRNTAQNFNPQAAKDQLAASRAIAELDEFIPNVAPKDVLAGSPAASGEVYKRGRDNWAAAQRSNDITGELDRATTGILERAEGRAQAANSGRNIDNTLRQKTEAVLEKPKDISGYTDAEIAALQGVVDGGTGRNLARNIGNKLGGGGGSAQTLFAGGGAAAGAAMGGVPGALMGAALPAVTGSTARSIANLLAKKDMRAVDELLRKRSPMYEERLANPEMSVVSPEKRAALLRMLLMGSDNR
jgi:hypothetical protein